MTSLTNQKNELSENGFIIQDFSLTNDLVQWVKEEKWDIIDQYFFKLCQSEGDLFKLLNPFTPFHSIEHMIAIRSSPIDEDGIWHDDGSRVLAFSLSLNINPLEIEGGELLIRKKGSLDLATIKPLPYGKIIIFLTGEYNFEHKICKVKKNRRIVLVGWCS